MVQECYRSLRNCIAAEKGADSFERCQHPLGDGTSVISIVDDEMRPSAYRQLQPKKR